MRKLEVTLCLSLLAACGGPTAPVPEPQATSATPSKPEAVASAVEAQATLAPISAAVATPVAAPTVVPTGALTLQTEQQKISYAIGMDIAHSIKQQGLDLDIQFLSAGLVAAYSGATCLLKDEEVQETLSSYQQKRIQEQNTQRQAQLEKNKKEGEEFLAKNKERPGVTTLPSGLQYEVLQEGTGAQPTADSKVKVNYRGTLLDGTEFDSSYKRGEPASFPVGGVIKGWTEALQLMKEGAKWKLYIPADLAYGERGAGRQIGPNSALIFEVELLSIESETEPASPAPEH